MTSIKMLRPTRAFRALPNGMEEKTVGQILQSGGTYSVAYTRKIDGWQGIQTISLFGEVGEEWLPADSFVEVEL